MGRLIDADKYMKRLQLAINDDADTIAEYIKRDTPIGTVKDGGRIGRLQGLQWCKNVLELDYYTVEAIPKDQYENRLKVDMVVMLEELKAEFEIMPCHVHRTKNGSVAVLSKEEIENAIQEKINALEGETK